MFQSSAILRELVQSLAKVTLLLKHSVKLRCRILCGDVAACCEMACVLFVVHNCSLRMVKTEIYRSDNYVYFHENLNFSKFNKKCIYW